MCLARAGREYCGGEGAPGVTELKPSCYLPTFDVDVSLSGGGAGSLRNACITPLVWIGLDWLNLIVVSISISLSIQFFFISYCFFKWFFIYTISNREVFFEFGSVSID